MRVDEEQDSDRRTRGLGTSALTRASGRAAPCVRLRVRPPLPSPGAAPGVRLPPDGPAGDEEKESNLLCLSLC